MEQLIKANLEAAVQTMRSSFVNLNRVGGPRDDYVGFCIKSMASVLEIVSTMVANAECCPDVEPAVIQPTATVSPPLTVLELAATPKPTVATAPDATQTGETAKSAPVAVPGVGKPRKRPQLV